MVFAGVIDVTHASGVVTSEKCNYGAVLSVLPDASDTLITPQRIIVIKHSAAAEQNFIYVKVSFNYMLIKSVLIPIHRPSIIFTVFCFCVGQVRQGAVTDQTVAAGPGRRRQMYTVELSGPMLPLAVAGLSRLFASTASGEFTASFAVHDPTLPLNCVRRHRKDARNDDDDGHLSIDSKAVACSATRVTWMSKLDADVCHEAELGKEGLRELVCRRGRYTWTLS